MPTQIKLEDAVAMLPDKPELSVVLAPRHGMHHRQTWVASNVRAHLTQHGAYLSGPQAREANHGLCSPYHDGGWIFVETDHE